MYEIKGTILKKSKYDDGSNNSQGTSAPPSRGQSSIGDSTDFDTPDSSAAGTPNGSRVKKDSLARKLKRLRRTSMLRTKGKNRRDHFRHLLMKRKIRAAIERKLGRSGKSMGESGAESGAESESDIDMDASTKTNASYRLLRAEVEEDMGIEKGDREQDTMGKVKEAQLMLKEYYRYAKKDVRNLSLEVRMESLCYSVPISSEAGKVMTVYNSSFLYPVYKFFQRTWRGEKKEPSRIGTKKVLDDINLVLKPGKMYLVLGPPTSGKSTLLRAITANLHPGKEDALEGAIKYNGQTLEVCHVQPGCTHSIHSQ
jgi:ABC-type multidrug transport system fused ATPase/permease subunit